MTMTISHTGSRRPHPAAYDAFAYAEMEAIPVASSVLSAVRYDERAQVLELTFESGAIYHYLDVPEPVKDALLDAPSKGTFFAAHIRDQYAFRRID